VGIMAGMSIGQAAERSGCTVATVRHYEDEGLLKGIGRAPNGRRVYGWPDIHRLRFVRRCRDLGFSIDDVRSLLGATDASSPDCLAVRDMAVAHIDRLRVMRAEIDALERSLSSLAKTCNEACATGRSPVCTIVEDLGATASG
jgi:DNA-binding transcriptional MerR regulator